MPAAGSDRRHATAHPQQRKGLVSTSCRRGWHGWNIGIQGTRPTITEDAHGACRTPAGSRGLNHVDPDTRIAAADFRAIVAIGTASPDTRRQDRHSRSGPVRPSPTTLSFIDTRGPSGASPGSGWHMTPMTSGTVRPDRVSRETRWTGSGARLDHSIAERRPFDGADHSAAIGCDTTEIVTTDRDGRSSESGGGSPDDVAAGNDDASRHARWGRGVGTARQAPLACQPVPECGPSSGTSASAAGSPSRFNPRRPSQDPERITVAELKPVPRGVPTDQSLTESVDDMPPSVSRHRRIAIDSAPAITTWTEGGVLSRRTAHGVIRNVGALSCREGVEEPTLLGSRGNARVRDQPFDDKCFT